MTESNIQYKKPGEAKQTLLLSRLHWLWSSNIKVESIKMEESSPVITFSGAQEFTVYDTPCRKFCKHLVELFDSKTTSKTNMAVAEILSPL